ncbi:hypothetical protein LP316_02120 [Thalassotalea sp. LPB0316]|uniref:hypothetical protein n=1 Tax=Thalassotalea sp. LPB0316 TaxID=2769490 RepID=UPI0018666C7E|nr:hypothetical protein [Thalassotalea sp. LPB0316]QOL26128.1 hypothetical protein LP316_02120 [Thalassotalea sp. LPB0316]
MKHIVTLLALLLPFSIMAKDSPLPDCTNYDNEHACYIDFRSDYWSGMRAQYQAKGLTYKYYVHPDFFSDLTDEEEEKSEELFKNGFTGYIEIAYTVDESGKTTDITVAHVSDERLEMFVPTAKNAIEQTEFAKMKKTVKAPNMRYYFLAGKEHEEDEDSEESEQD